MNMLTLFTVNNKDTRVVSCFPAKIYLFKVSN